MVVIITRIDGDEKHDTDHQKTNQKNQLLFHASYDIMGHIPRLIVLVYDETYFIAIESSMDTPDDHICNSCCVWQPRASTVG